jgi:hypothetical protein
MIITKTLAYLRHKLAVVIFGVLLPVVLFFNAYPGGVHEMVERVKFSYRMGSIHNTVRVVLEQEFGGLQTDDYVNAVRTIENASSDTRVLVVVKENFGGAVNLLLPIMEAAQRSTAVVVVTVERFGFSCGGDIILSGDYAIIPTDSLLMYHTGAFHGETIKEPTMFSPKYMNWAYQLVNLLTSPYKAWMTSEQREKFKTGASIWITGGELCSKRDGREVDVLFQYDGGCVIKGNKPGFLEIIERVKQMMAVENKGGVV